LTRRTLGIVGRMLALRGEAVFYITDDGLIPASDWDLTTRLSVPTAYRLTLSDTNGGQTVTALAGEVLHFRIGSDAVQPWIGTAPLRRSSLSADLLQIIESAMMEIYRDAPLGSSVLPMPEMAETDLSDLARGFRGHRGRVNVRESVAVTSAGGPVPQTDWRVNDLTPDLQRAMLGQSLEVAKDQIVTAFGFLPGLFNRTTTGPMVRESQRHAAQWTLQPIAELIAEEAILKLGLPVVIGLERPLQAFDQGGRARAAKTLIDMMATAKEAGVDPMQAMRIVDWAK
jgi:hypothetical protein